jgi:hypothetical protein
MNWTWRQSGLSLWRGAKRSPSKGTRDQAQRAKRCRNSQEQQQLNEAQCWREENRSLNRRIAESARSTLVLDGWGAAAHDQGALWRMIVGGRSNR